MENGSYKIGCVPYGYTKDEHGEMIIVPEEADVIQYIFNSVVSGMGVYKIAKNLNARHIPARKGGKWSTTTLLDILVNEKYVGDALFQKTYTDSNFHRHDNHGEMKTHLVQAQTVMDDAAKAEHKKRIRELRAFIRSQPHDITEFDETLVKHLLERVTVFEDYLVFRLKSGVEVVVGK